jgi:hypothetical protein
MYEKTFKLTPSAEGKMRLLRDVVFFSALLFSLCLVALIPHTSVELSLRDTCLEELGTDFAGLTRWRPERFLAYLGFDLWLVFFTATVLLNSDLNGGRVARISTRGRSGGQR